MAHRMRAVRAAWATATTLLGRRAIMPRNQGEAFSGRALTWRSQAVAPSTSSRRKGELPCLVMAPVRVLPPVPLSRGAKPSQAALQSIGRRIEGGSLIGQRRRGNHRIGRQLERTGAQLIDQAGQAGAALA